MQGLYDVLDAMTDIDKAESQEYGSQLDVFDVIVENDQDTMMEDFLSTATRSVH
jgi:hypothetical protein